MLVNHRCCLKSKDVGYFLRLTKQEPIPVLNESLPPFKFSLTIACEAHLLGETVTTMSEWISSLDAANFFTVMNASGEAVSQPLVRSSSMLSNRST